MEVLIFLLGLFSVIAVPLGVIATVQYCVLANRILDFKKLLLFSWSMVFACIPFSFAFSGVLLLTLIENPPVRLFGEVYHLSTIALLASLGYLLIGWMICSGLNGRLILPNISSNKINLP